MTALETLRETVRLAGVLGGSLHLTTADAHKLMNTGDLGTRNALADAAAASLSYDTRGFCLLTAKPKS